MRLMSIVLRRGELERAAADRLGAQVGDDHLAVGRAQLVGLGRRADQRVERLAGAALELGRSRPAGTGARPGARGRPGRSRPSRRSAGARRRASRRRAARAAPAVSGASSDSASASLRRSSSASSATPFAVARATRTRRSLLAGVDASPSRRPRARAAAGSGGRSRARAGCAARAPRSPPAPTSHSTRASPSGRSSARKWSSSAPTRWVTVRLKRRTCSTMRARPLPDFSQVSRARVKRALALLPRWRDSSVGRAHD